MSRPNIILVLTDDQGWGDLACHGNPWIQTPNIDHFYSESVRLCDYHVGPTCAPTRAGLFTGHYANSTGVWHTIGGRSLLRADEWTIASALSENGYRTGIFGKWHLGDTYPYRPQDRGFEYTLVHGGGGISQTPDYWGNDYFDDTYFENGVPRRFKGYCTDVFFSEAMRFIGNGDERPFFCCITTNAPHSPYNVPDKYRLMYEGKVIPERARFYGMITNIDENFARLRTFLSDARIADNTLLIFMTDNGSSCSMSYDRGGRLIEGYNGGLRGMKNSEYDGGHRTPCFILWERGGISGGRDVTQPTANVDIMPTLLDVAGVSAGEHTFDGISLMQVLTNPDAKLPERMIVTDSQRLTNPIKWRKSCVIYGKWRLVNRDELYDIEADRAQENDISAEYPDLVDKLREGYEVWWEKVSQRFDEPIPIPLRSGSRLTAHDWHAPDECCVWNQGQIRSAPEVYGDWEVSVPAQADTEMCGVNDVEMCSLRLRFYRWAPETGYAVSKGIDGCDVDAAEGQVQPEYMSMYTGGRAVEVTGIRLYVDGELIMSQAFDGSTPYAQLDAKLPSGNHTLGARFVTAQGNELGAYYMEIV